MCFYQQVVYKTSAYGNRARQLAFTIYILLLPTVAHAGGQYLAMIYAASFLALACLSTFLWFGGIFWYGKLIARIFGVPDHIADSDWWPWACFFSTGFIFILVKVAL